MFFKLFSFISFIGGTGKKWRDIKELDLLLFSKFHLVSGFVFKLTLWRDMIYWNSMVWLQKPFQSFINCISMGL